MAKNSSDMKVAWVIDQLALRRKEIGMSHEKLATKIKLSRSAIGLIESKKRNPTLLTILKICDALGISLGELILEYEQN
jgi:transcriptional regulator with XRE-family HTH domain